MMLLPAILLVVLWRVSVSQPAEKNILYVRTDKHQLCLTTSETCYTFVEYLHGYQHLFTSNTTIHFMPGEHLINSSGSNSQTVLIANLEDFTLEGTAVPPGEPPAVTLQCTQLISFHFTNMTRLVIQNINITNCGSTDNAFSFLPDLVRSYYFNAVWNTHWLINHRKFMQHIHSQCSHV